MAQSLEDLTTDQLLAFAKQAQGSHALLTTLSRNPETRAMVQQAMKKLNPNMVIPELDTKAQVDAAVAEERKERLKLEEQIRRDAITKSVTEERTRVKTAYQLTDADMIEVEKLMTAEVNPISNYDAAARVFRAEKKTALPTPAALASPTFQMPEKDIWGPGIGNKARLDRIAMDEAFKAFNEISGGRVPAQV